MSAPFDVQALRELLAKATPRPWRARSQHDRMQIVSGGSPPDAGVADCGLDLGDDWPGNANAVLIAAAINVLPELLDVYERETPAARARREGEAVAQAFIEGLETPPEDLPTLEMPPELKEWVDAGMPSIWSPYAPSKKP